MANPHKGEVDFEITNTDGAAQTYTLRFSANALCELEDVLDMGINVIATQLSDVKDLRLKTVRAVFWAGLRDHHPGVTLREAGEIVTSMTLPVALEVVAKAFTAAFPEPPTKADPPPPVPSAGPAKIAAGGTGNVSLDNGVNKVSTTKSSGLGRPGTSSPSSTHAKPS